uniref:Heat shock factor binding protein 1 n=1 Tax=Rhabditophanes sp. KR3021 TaxID=114890 RepID=A0AC35UAP1_9BILA
MDSTSKDVTLKDTTINADNEDPVSNDIDQLTQVISTVLNETNERQLEILKKFESKIDGMLKRMSELERVVDNLVTKATDEMNG